MKKTKKKIVITGGAGFIGSHVVRRFVTRYPEYEVTNLDALTYAGNLENIKDLEKCDNYRFVKGDIKDPDFLRELFRKERFDAVIHLAAESHVDRSITDPNDFIETNVLGTANLMNAFIDLHRDSFEDKLFYHVSTDEVYGSLGKEGLFTETTPYDPQSPYAASKAASDHLVRAYGNTYGMPFVISNCSNNYGSHQFPEKLIPLFIHNIRNKKELPVYGDGQYTRDWLYVVDHAIAIDQIFHKARNGQTYNIGGVNEWTNLDLIHLLCKIMDEKLNQDEGTSAALIRFVKDRAGHDRRYAIDASKINRELGWEPSVTFEEGLEKTVDWYLSNSDWLESVTSGAYQAYYNQMYG
jgi:dTDP-glucose 4,6-dehydratase